MQESRWYSETSIRKQIRNGCRTSDNFIGSVVRVSLWQLALMCDAEGKSCRYPGLLELVTARRRQKGKQRSQYPCSKWISKTIEFWYLMGPEYQKQLLWEGMRGKIVAGVEDNGIIREAKPKGFAKTIILHSSIYQIDIQQRLKFNIASHTTFELDKWWDRLPKSNGIIRRPVYFWLYRQIISLLLPDISRDEMLVLLIRDWEVDTDNATHMTKPQFVKSIISLTHVQCETNSVTECNNFISALHRVVMRHGVPSSNEADYCKYEVSAGELEETISHLITSVRDASQLVTAYDLAIVASRCMLLDPTCRDNMKYFKARPFVGLHTREHEMSTCRSLLIPDSYHRIGLYKSKKKKKKKPKIGRATLTHSTGARHSADVVPDEISSTLGSPVFIPTDTLIVSWRKLSKPLIYGELEFLGRHQARLPTPDRSTTPTLEEPERASLVDPLFFFRSRDSYFNSIPTGELKRKLLREQQQQSEALCLPSIVSGKEVKDVKDNHIASSIAGLSRAPLPPFRPLVPNT